MSLASKGNSNLNNLQEDLRPIEKTDGLPVESLSKLVKIEGRGPEVSRPPLYIHKWWAKRFGSVFRSILLGILLDNNEDIWAAHYHNHNYPDICILDPFMGSGTTLFEASRLNTKIIGCDLNPVAWWTTRSALQQPDDWKDLEKAFLKLEQEALKLFRDLYKTKCPTCDSNTANARHIRWAHVLPCAHCGHKTRLIKSYNLGRYKNGNWFLCPSCDFVFWSDQNHLDKIQCPACQDRFSAKKGNTSHGKFICSVCNGTTSIRHAMNQQENVVEDAEMYAVLFDCPEHGWGLAPPTEIDRQNYERAKELLQVLSSELAIPNAPITKANRSDPRPTNYGYKLWRQMFTSRQLLVLGWLAAQIKDLPQSEKDIFATIISQLVNYTNGFCVPRPNRPAAISWIFRMHAFVPPTDFIENNPLGGEKSSGTFQSIFWRSIQRAYEYRHQPVERKIKPGTQNQSYPVHIKGEQITPTLVTNWQEFETSLKPALLLCQSSEHLPLPDKSVSHIVTDPPFYDNITYSELSEFNYVWLHEMLKDDYNEFATPSIQHQRELIVSKRIGKDNDFYTTGLANVFRECHRVLKDNGLLVFTFHHKSEAAWISLLEALVQSTFRVTAVHPVRSESDRSLHIMNGDSIEHDIIIVCRKAANPEPITWDDLLARMDHEATKLVDRLVPKLRQSMANVSVVVFGQCLKLFTQHYPLIEGTSFTTADVLSVAQQIAVNCLNDHPKTQTTKV